MPNAPLISIVEDDELFGDSMRRLLGSLDYRAEAFPSAADFLASRCLDETACLIADLHMPAMTGLELYARLIELRHRIPTILVTAYADEATRARALKLGIVCYLTKPFHKDDLLACVRKGVESDKRRAENS